MQTTQAFIRFRRTETTIPVGKIVCLGRNYAAHVKEMKAEIPEKPLIFLKPSTAIVHDGGCVVTPPYSSDLHHEVEMVVAMGKTARNVSEQSAMEHVSGYGVGLDMTLRDLQAEAKKLGQPWTVAKGFDTSAPVSEFAPREEVPDPHSLAISLKVNGMLRQSSNTRNMLIRVESVISYISSVMTLEPGDLVFTGTPEGVGSVRPGDIIEAELASVGSLKVSIVR
jgi:2-keto-4-pentenoate hydratase/2-oxohepta-3-ene-1,7-dioic acid hydratase in catechol pathway